MSQSVNVNFKLDADVKKSMEQVCSELGLSMSAAFTVFAKKVGREKRIPFEVSVDRFILIAISVIWKISCAILRMAKLTSQSMI